MSGMAKCHPKMFCFLPVGASIVTGSARGRYRSTGGGLRGLAAFITQGESGIVRVDWAEARVERAGAIVKVGKVGVR